MLTVESFDTLAAAGGAMAPRSRYLAGGTLVMRAVNYGDQSFDRIVRTDDPGLKTIRAEGDRLSIGAGVTMAQIMASPDLAFLAEAARAVGGPAIRNMATIGGNLFAPHPYGDLATALLALDGQVRMADGSDLVLEEFLSRRDALQGLVASVSVMRPMGGEFRFRKVSRVKPKGVSVLCIAAWLPRRGGRLSQTRVAFGAMGPTPLRAKSVERSLEGATLDETGIRPALEVTMEGLDPPDDALASAWYRREVAPVHLKRLLLDEGRR